MSQLLAQIVADVLAQQKGDILDTLLNHDRRLLVIAHNIRMASLTIHRLMDRPHLLIQLVEFLLCLNL